MMSAATVPLTSLALERAPRASRPLQLDGVTLALVAALLLLGLIAMSSASMALAGQQGGDPLSLLKRQLLAAALGGALATGLVFLPTRFLRQAAVPGALLALVLLACALFGHPVNGSRRWLHLAGLNFQPSEVARPLILLYLAARAAEPGGLSGRQLRTPLILLVLSAGLLAAEPDFGDTGVLLASGLGLLYLAGARLWPLLRVALPLSALLGVLASVSHYGLARLRSFLDPWADPYHAGFQLTQSLIAFGRGQQWGVGLGDGVQKLFYLPEAHTDFVLASAAEELGLAGVCTTVGLFLGLIGRSFVTARQAFRVGLTFQSLLAASFGVWLGLQAFINMGVNMGVLPTKGLTLPLMSYGRSSLIVTLAGVGVLMRVYHETRIRPGAGDHHG